MEATETALVPTKHSLLRPDQVDEMREEKKALEVKLHNPRIEDKGAVMEQLRRLDHQFETQRPKPFSSAEVDRGMRRISELEDKIRDGMLSHEEMRKCPPGAIDRHRNWEAKNLDNITEWQNLQRRLNAENDNRESASIERLRPLASTMNMDNAMIPGKQYFGPAPGAGPTVTFNSEEIAKLRELAPDMALRLPTLSNEQRGELKTVLLEFMNTKEAA